MLCIVCCPLLYYSYRLYEMVHARNIAGAIKFSDFWMTAVGSVVYQVYRQLCYVFLTDHCTKACLEKDPKKRHYYIERSIESAAKASFHIVAFFWGWIAIRNAGWLPWCLGGTTTVRELFTSKTLESFPFHSPPPEVVRYGLYCAGYHFSEMIRHGFFSVHKSDFVEMVFHHICTSSLIFGYLISNVHVIGAFIAVLHDCSDIFMNLGRIWHGTKFESTLCFGFVLCMYTTWIWTRLITLPHGIWVLVSEPTFG